MKDFIDKALARPAAVAIIIGAITASVVKIVKAVEKAK